MARWIGIDVTATSVRVALVNSGYRASALLALREENVSDHESASTAIRMACMGLKADSLACAISGQRGFLRRISVPAAAQKELANVLSFEVEATLPVELDDAVMDHRVLHPLPGLDAPGFLPILAAVAYTHDVRDTINLVRRATGQEPARVGVGGLPLCNLVNVCSGLQTPDPIAVVDLGDHYTDVVVMQRGEPRMARCLSHGVAGLPGTAGALARDLRQTVSAWRGQGGAALSQVVVVGVGATTTGLEGFLSTEVGLRSVAFPGLTLDVNAGDLPQLPRYAKAIALALGSRRPTDLNLRQGPLEAQQQYQFVRDKTPLLAGLFAAIAVSFGFSVFAEMRALDAERVALEARLLSASRQVLDAETSDPVAIKTALEDLRKGKSLDPVPPMDAFDLLVELSERIPDSIVHDIAELDYNRGDVVIRGIVPTIDDAHVVAAGMEQHPCFHDVNIGRTTKLQSKDRQQYVLELKVDCTRRKTVAKDAAPAASATASSKGGGE